MHRITSSSFVFTLALTSVAAPARAQFSEPGSLLVFPEYDTRPGIATLLTVTNTDASSPSVLVEFNYVDGATCLVRNARNVLTPKDSLSVSVELHNPDVDRGFVYAYAARTTNGDPIAFDFLIGSVTHIDGIMEHAYTMNAFSFKSPLQQGDPTDRDNDGIRDLDGSEYQAAPDVIHVPRFIGQLGEFGASSNFVSRLILIALSGGAQFRTTVGFTVFNDNEQAFSARARFRCWTKVQLSSISPAFRNDFLLASNDDPMERVATGREAGWFTIDGLFAVSSSALIDDPAVLAVLIDPPSLASAELPFTMGTQANGDLLPTNALGDE